LNHPGRIKVLVVEPLALMRDALTCLLQSAGDMEVARGVAWQISARFTMPRAVSTAATTPTCPEPWIKVPPRAP